MRTKLIVTALVLTVMTGMIAPLCSRATGTENATPAPAGQEEPKKVFDAHDTGVRYHFTDTDMDFNFGTLVLGAAVNHGVEIGEAFYTASRIKDGDAASWQQEWHALAQLVQARGERALAAGHRISARDQLLRAANYYRISALAILPDDSRLKERAETSRSLLKKAGALLDPPLEYFEIPFENTKLPGYFWPASAAKQPAKT